jgi:hypothetical protein
MGLLLARWLPLLILASEAPRADEPPAALTVRLIRPDRQLERLLDLFDGARAPHPAAALAAWRRATHRTLSKSREAMIAALNPEMVRELRTLDGAEVRLRFGDGPARWSATVPGDDGTFAALATAMGLTGGGRDEPLEGLAVDRLGPPGSPVMTILATGVAVASARDGLGEALRTLGAARPDRPPIASGATVRLDLDSLAAPGSLTRRRFAEALRALGGRSAEGVATLDGDLLSLSVTGRFTTSTPKGDPIDPLWLDWIPSANVLAAFALSLDPSPSAWDSAFAAADRVEKADPARAGLAPLRTRLNLLALPAGIRPEVDLWPRLRGLSGGLLADPSGDITGVVLALHCVDEAAAERIASTVLPRLASAFRVGEVDPARPPEADGSRRLGRVSGRPLVEARRRAGVLIAWGDGVLASCLDAAAHPDRSAGPAIRAAWGPTAPRRAGALWTGRLSGLPPELAAALAEAPPVLWWGDRDGEHTRDEVRWTGLAATVRRFLDRLPLDPAGRP